jgi:Peptidase family M28
MHRRWVSISALVMCLVLSALYGSAPLFLPKPADASVPSDQFSADRAMAYVRTLAETPRMSGTPGMDRSAAYLVEMLSSCDLTPEIQDASAQNGTLHNVVVHISGSNHENAVLIVSHVDSVSFGAGDNATGSAVLMELACNLQAGSQLRNDVILLFEDGEEAGYLGGYAFTATDPSVKTIRRVVGLDTAAWGPVVLLQTSPGNAGFIQAYATSVPNPTAFGFFADADWNISHDTSEIQPFYELGIPGLELEDPTAFSGKHSAADTIENIKPGSMQQMGEQVLTLTKYLANSDLTTTSSSNFSYFTLFALGTIHYPSQLNILLVILSALVLIVLSISGARQSTITVRNLVYSAVLITLSFIGAAIIGIAGSVLFDKFFPNPNPNTGSYLIPASLPFFLTVIVIVGIVFLLVRKKIETRYGSSLLKISGLYAWLLFSIILVIIVPVGSYLFIIPLSLAIVIQIFPERWKYASLVPAIIAAILFTPNIVLAFLGTGQQTLVLVSLFVVLIIELWAQAYSNLVS